MVVYVLHAPIKTLGGKSARGGGRAKKEIVPGLFLDVVGRRERNCWP